MGSGSPKREGAPTSGAVRGDFEGRADTGGRGGQGPTRTDSVADPVLAPMRSSLTKANDLKSPTG